MATGWTLERRQRQAEAIQTWRPWERSTGPTSAAGKAKVARNAFKGGLRQQMRALSRECNSEIRFMREFNDRVKP
jgi:hypothetical protein